MKLSNFVLTAIVAFLLTACQTTGSSAYKVGQVGNVLTVNYGDGLPMTIYLPPNTQGKVPVLVYHHGRAFHGWKDGEYKLHPRSVAVTELNEAGIALAVPVRSGYHSASGSDGERIPCNNPSMADFERAARSARRDVSASIDKVRSMPEFNPDQVYLAGQSAGGFAAAVSLEKVDLRIGGTMIFAGGRCGRRTPLGGFEFSKELIRQNSANSTKPLVFLAGEYDQVTPIAAVRGYYEAACAARGAACADTVRFIKAKEARHRFEDIFWPARAEVIKLIQTGSL